MIDVTLTKENALPYDLWGLLSESWKPAPDEGVTVFLQGLEKRGPDNRRKRIYMSAVTPDLYRPMYSEKVAQFFDKLLDPENADKPLMRPYLDAYWDLYWDLHLGVKGDAIPRAGAADRRELQHRAGLSRSHPEDRLRQLHDACARTCAFLKTWIDERLDDIAKRQDPESREDVRLLLAQERRRRRALHAQGRRVRVLPQLRGVQPVGQHALQHHAEARARTAAIPTRGPGSRRRWRGASIRRGGGGAFTPLDRFVMELFRTISPNGGSISALEETRTPPFERHGYVVSPHYATSLDPRHWKDPERFDPDRYNDRADQPPDRRGQVRADRLRQVPVRAHAFEVKDGRKAVAAQQRASAPSTASSTASRCRCATMPASRRSASAIAAARASSSPSRSSRTSCARCGSEQDRVREAQDRQRRNGFLSGPPPSSMMMSAL